MRSTGPLGLASLRPGPSGLVSPAFVRIISHAVCQLLLGLIWLYQRTLSPLLGPSCRFQPSCSRYAAACLSTHGPLRGTWLAVKRIARCHPFHPGGYDPPPEAGSATHHRDSKQSPAR